MNDIETTEKEVSQPIRIGISSCLLGDEVRFDGGHKRDAYVSGTLSSYFEFVPVCPEVAIGLGTPREPIRLVRIEDEVRVRGVRTPDLDVTQPLREYGRKMAAQLRDISGYILKRGSPSCGMERVKIYSEQGMPSKNGVGAYAELFMAEQPLLPCEEEGRLSDPVLRENFIVRVFVYHRWQQLVAAGLTPARLVDFHTEHKFLLLAHNESAYRRMGRMVADAGKASMAELRENYAVELMSALKRRAGRKQHTNVLQHLLGYVSDHLDTDDRAEIVEIIDQYRRGLVPLIVPITMLNHHFRRHPSDYVSRQHYLSPHPHELMLRNLL
ncbi:MAG: DUF523 and DUF1722 domain-containing protein [Gammaproteobacteria bacterium]|nr:DUF523 and DUF1722 domain-containing protein [Gammaproteobacteria bacterium]MDX2461692.1 DUF523 and DUF1722 domain-containing protein [Gammaproteobacteria bacterium]